MGAAMKRHLSFLPLIVIALAGPPGRAQGPGSVRDSLLEPFSTRDQVEEFLRTARVVASRGTPRGITSPERLTLDDGKVRHDALFKRIDERKKGITQLERSAEYDFKDSWKFEVAAYEIDKLLGLNMVPVTVAREYMGTKGSLQYWVDDCMLEKERLEKKIMPPDPIRWMWQIHQVRVFDQLVYNIDRNLGNILVTPDFRCVMIDHSRCFKSVGELRSPKEMEVFSRSMMEALAKLDEAALRQRCGEFLTPPEIQTTLQRRDLILGHYEKTVKARGYGIVSP